MTLDTATPGVHLLILDEVIILEVLVVVHTGEEAGVRAEAEVEAVAVAVVIAAGALGMF